MKVSLVESVQEVGGKLQSMTTSMRNDTPNDEVAERDSGHHFELSAIEVIEGGLLAQSDEEMP